MAGKAQERGGRILLVDHFKAKAASLKKNLEKLGYEVQVSPSADEGLSRAGDWLPDTVVVRLSMPKKDGVEFCEAFRKRRQHKKIPVIFLVPAKVNDSLFAKALKAGGNEFLQKVNSPSILSARIQSQINANAQAREIEKLQTTDGLTGLLSRRVLLEELERQVKGLLAMRTEKVTCLLMELDGFKAINTEEGHATGDKMLSATARLLLRTVRDGDLIARHSGATFAVLLDDASLDIAKQRAEAIRSAVQNAKLPVKATASCGVASITHEWLEDNESPQAGQVVQALLHRADHALKRAKKADGNKVRAYVG